MAITVGRLKEIVKKSTRVEITGLKLSKNNQYWANSDQIDYMKDTVEQICLDPRFQVTEKQKQSLNNWIEGLKRTYLS